MFESRATGEEFLDRTDCDPDLAVMSFSLMEMVNRRLGGTRAVRRFLAAESARRKDDAPLRILDIGSGSCDIPLAISRWGRTHNIPLQFTCVEMADHAISIARAKLDQVNDPAVHLLQENIFAHQPAEPYDYAIASMCFHHFKNNMIIALLRKLRGIVLGGVLINDLRRSRLAYFGAGLLLLGAPFGLRHDALLSIRRGFQVKELYALLRQLDAVTVSVKPAWCFRISATVRYTQGGFS